MHKVSINVISGESFGGCFELGVQLLGKRQIFVRGKGSQNIEGCRGVTRTEAGVLTMGRVATSVASMVTLPGRLSSLS